MCTPARHMHLPTAEQLRAMYPDAGPNTVIEWPPKPKADPLVEHKARIEREQKAAMRENQIGLWILAAILAVGVLKVAGLLP